MDNELEAIRARRLQELQQQHQAAKGPSGGGGDDGQARQERKEKEDEFRNTILSQILSQEARARLNTIKTAKPEKGKMLEDILINNARMGAISSKLSENDLKSILERVSQQFNKETKVQFDRRRACIDSDDE